MDAVLELTMAEAGSERRTMPIRIDVRALEAAKIAAAFKGVSVMEYASQVLLEAAERDIEQGYKARSGGQPPARPKPKEPPKGGPKP